jgi:hypothetical protein
MNGQIFDSKYEEEQTDTMSNRQGLVRGEGTPHGSFWLTKTSTAK